MTEICDGHGYAHRVSNDHYFSPREEPLEETHSITVPLVGHDFTLTSAKGVFSAHRLDPGTAVLIKNAPIPRGPECVDLGCGWGPIALSMGMLNPTARVWAVDVNAHARALVAKNAHVISASHPLADVVPAAPDAPEIPRTIDELWSHPPIRIGKDALHALLTAWLPRLRPEGRARLVVQRNLGADSLARWIAAQTDENGNPWGSLTRESTAKGYRVLRFTRQ